MGRSGESIYPESRSIPRLVNKKPMNPAKFVNEASGDGPVHAHEYDKYVNSERRCTKCSSQKIMP